jgi:hypothetical protein
LLLTVGTAIEGSTNVAARATHPRTRRYAVLNDLQTSTGFIVAMVIVVGLAVLGAIINAFDGDSNGGSSTSDSSDALTERTCEIARDISQDAADGVDTTFETRDRFKDLLDGYGESALADIAIPLRDIVAALTSLDNAALSSAVGRLDSACSSRGF